MKNIIAFSLWGDNPMYWQGALENIELAKKYYPGWYCRFYIDDKSDINLIQTIKGDNVEVVLVNSKDSFEGTFWRFYASADPDVNIFMSRDTDSRLSEREYYAVQEWLKSNKDFHIMRDHPYHTVPILAGMWGCRNGLMRDDKLDILNKIKSWVYFKQKGCDQDFLCQIIYPYIVNKSMEHSEFGLRFGGNIISFPTKRKDYEFVGDVFDENNNRHPEYWKIIKNN